MTLSVTPLAYALGAEVAGLDLSRELDDLTVKELREAWLRHLVLVFRGQDLDDRQQIAFTSRFGEVERAPVKRAAARQGSPEIVDIRGEMNIGRNWHADGVYTLRPTTGSVLYCTAIPDAGGDTWFTSMYLAYETLSERLARVVGELEVVNDVLHSGTVARLMSAEQLAQTRAELPPVVQPAVRVHPETGRRALAVSEGFSCRFDGMTEKESQGLLQYLFAHSTRPEFTFRHKWRPGDVVMWDNRCTMHLAPADYDRAQPRVMRRTTLAGEPRGRIADGER
jgi:taurine dioxygenase